jgi:hypothetical protein
MTWLTWRQHRGEALGAALVLGALGALLLALGLAMHSAYSGDGVAACLARSGSGHECSDLVGRFVDRYGAGSDFVSSWLHLLPALAGVFVGAPLLAREYEHGTWQLAWTQSVSRRRWLVTKLALVVAAITLAAGSFTVLYSWWHQPFDQIDGRLGSVSFNFEGTAFTAHTLYAFAAGTLAGMLVRRTVPAMVAALAAFFAARLPIEFWLRPHLAKPLTATFDPLRDQHPAAARGDWIIDHGYATASGTPLSDSAQAAMFEHARDSHLNLVSYAHQHGLLRWTRYHPADGFWHFQLLESAIFLALAAALIAVVIARIHRTTP